mgnify:CR=1 FL=1
MNILLVGGTCSLMNNIILKLRKEGHRVFLLTGDKYKHSKYEKVFERYDFPYDSENLNEIIESVNPDVTILLGAFDTNYLWNGEERETVHFISHMVNILVAYSVVNRGKLIYLSSDEVFSGDYPDDITEGEKFSGYGIRPAALSQAEELCENFRVNRGLDITVLRLDHLYSIPKDKNDINNICAGMCLEYLRDGYIKADENHTFSMLYEKDAVEYIYKVVKSKKRAHSIYHLSSNDVVNEVELASWILQVMQSEANIVTTPGKNGRCVLSNIISSQIAIHTLYGGVVPEIASRKHIEKINQVIEEALKEAGVTLDDLDAIGVTYGPGLVGALLVGVAEAKAISFAKDLPLVGVHHIEGHISANYIENLDLEPPFLCLVVSGGHTHLVIVKDYGEFEILGRTRDDAAGEAFDKVARAIGLGYPGGPKIDKLSKEGNPYAFDFPKAKIEDAPYDFSFSGVKSAVLNHLNKCKMQGEEIVAADIAASFQRCVVEVLVEHAIMAAKDYHIKKLAIAGGVASNSGLRSAMEEACKKNQIKFYHPSPIFCTDNAAMIGVAAYYEFLKGTRHGMDLNAVPNLKLGER